MGPYPGNRARIQGCEEHADRMLALQEALGPENGPLGNSNAVTVSSFTWNGASCPNADTTLSPSSNNPSQDTLGHRVPGYKRYSVALWWPLARIPSFAAGLNTLHALKKEAKLGRTLQLQPASKALQFLEQTEKEAKQDRRCLCSPKLLTATGSANLDPPLDRGSLMDTSEPSSATEEEEEKVAEDQRPRTRSNPEGAEDRVLSAHASVGNRSEGEGEAASTGDSPQNTAVPDANGKGWPSPAAPTEFQVRTPRVNCPEKVIICLDLSEEMSLSKLESFNGSKTNALNISQKMVEMFVRTKHKIDKSHEFALVVVNNNVTWLSGFTSDPREVCSCLYDLETVVCKSFNLEGLFNLIQQKTELPVTENIQTIPPPYVVRTILVYSRLACRPPATVTEQMKKMLQCPYFFFDVLYIHNGGEDKEEGNGWKETFAFFSNLDSKGTNYKYAVSLTGPAVELHNCMAKLLAHPLQRPFQTHASYSMLEDEEAAEIEAVV